MRTAARKCLNHNVPLAMYTASARTPTTKQRRVSFVLNRVKGYGPHTPSARSFALFSHTVRQFGVYEKFMLPQLLHALLHTQRMSGGWSGAPQPKGSAR